MPVGSGFDTLVTLGPLPTKIGLESQCYAGRPDESGSEGSCDLATGRRRPGMVQAATIQLIAGKGTLGFFQRSYV